MLRKQVARSSALSAPRTRAARNSALAVLRKQVARNSALELPGLDKPAALLFDFRMPVLDKPAAFPAPELPARYKLAALPFALDYLWQSDPLAEWIQLAA